MYRSSPFRSTLDTKDIALYLHLQICKSANGFRKIKSFQNVVQDNWRSRSHDQNQKQADMELLRHLRSKVVQTRQNVNWQGNGNTFVWSILIFVKFGPSILNILHVLGF